ncbi:MAG TPA: hypothetical protein PKM57_18380 [Kiritimatiellia bacterium]|nr:hypothetical protein [Kiritimatiellia bacterium]HPS09585.1 hypothetical protein [Kiritimatiellia bacterium]
MTRHVEFGDTLYRTLNASMAQLFKLGELIQLSHNAFALAVQNIQQSADEQIKLTYPLGVRPDGQAIVGENQYAKKDIIGHYQHLSAFELAKNGIYQLVTITETVLGDCLRLILLQYPKKIGAKRSIALSTIFECSSLEGVHLAAISALINELSYKSPREFAEVASEICGFNILEIPAYHQFIEIKATRDVYIHDRGQANAIYCNKAGSHARVQQGQSLPMIPKYFLDSHEFCMRLIESLMAEFHKVWPSQEYQAAQEQQKS